MNARRKPVRVRRGPRSGPAWATGALTAVLVAVLLSGIGVATALRGAFPHAVPAEAVAGALEPASEPGPAVPLVIRVPRLGIVSDLVPLGTDADGVLQPPGSADVAGWHAGGTVPGEVGPAVIAGHVDSRSGPGVFFRLADLEPGDEIQVVRSDTAMPLTFEVLSTETVGKGEFPTGRVYGPTPIAELHLVTCGGDFDQRSRHYRDNVIVRAALADYV